jgi:hypothetical protein
LGLVLAGFDEGGCQERTRVESNLWHFHGYYGVSPESCATLFEDLRLGLTSQTQLTWWWHSIGWKHTR